MHEFTPWTEAEDAALVAAAENAERDTTGRILWRQIVTLPDRNSYAMQQRYYAVRHNVTGNRPHVFRRKWSPDEDAKLTLLVEQFTVNKKVDWDAISGELPGRTRYSAECHWKAKHRCLHVVQPLVIADGVRRACLCCRRPFDSPDRRRVWICDRCKDSERMAA
jgi:hypothetical protein